MWSTGLYDGGVPCGKGVCQGLNGQEEGVAPGTHDQNVNVGNGLKKAPGGEL